MALGQGLGLYRGGKETRKSPVKTIAREKKGLKQNTKEHWEAIYHNTILARLTLERHIKVKGAEANASKRNQSHNMVNTMGDNVLRAPRRPNKGKKHNGNTPKDRSNKTKKLALLGRCLNKQPKVQMQLAKTNTKTHNIIMPPIYQPKNNTFNT